MDKRQTVLACLFYSKPPPVMDHRQSFKEGYLSDTPAELVGNTAVVPDMVVSLGTMAGPDTVVQASVDTMVFPDMVAPADTMAGPDTVVQASVDTAVVPDMVVSLDTMVGPDTVVQVLDMVESVGETPSRGRTRLFDRPRSQCQNQRVLLVQFQVWSWGPALCLQIPAKTTAE